MSDLPTSISEYRQRGSVTLLMFGERFGVHKTTARRWELNGVPAERVLDVERETGVSRYLLRPDIYGAAPSDPAKADGAAPLSVSHSDAEPFACAENQFPKPRNLVARAG